MADYADILITGAHLFTMQGAGVGYVPEGAVLVAGRFLVRDYKVLTADEPAIRAEAQRQATAVARQVAADPVHRQMALMEAMAAGQL